MAAARKYRIASLNSLTVAMVWYEIELEPPADPDRRLRAMRHAIDSL